MRIAVATLLALLALALLPAPATAQTPHQVSLSWNDTSNPSGTTYTVYRSAGPCSTTPTWTKVASGVATLTYPDKTVTAGVYCYEVTANAGGLESSPSNTAPATVLPFPPVQLQVTVN